MLPHTVEDRLEPALAGRARSFIADFHALQPTFRTSDPSFLRISILPSE